jgi:hypothetical protein
MKRKIPHPLLGVRRVVVYHFPFVVEDPSVASERILLLKVDGV